MTFIPSVISKIDSNNSITSATNNFVGVWTELSGYNSINVLITSNVTSSAGGIEIQYSDDGITGQTYYSDTYFTENSDYSKTFPILKKYFRVSFTLSSLVSVNLNITTRLDTTSNNSPNDIINQYSNTQEPFYDAFGKLRVSNPFTIIDLKIPGSTGTVEYRQNQLMITYNSTGSGSGTGYVSTSPGYLTLNVSNNWTQTNQSQKYSIYQPGKSYLFLGSGIIKPSGGVVTNMLGRVGLFDNQNGVYFECDGSGNNKVVIRNNGSVSISVSQSNWNIDKMDGTGNSGFNLDFSTNQLFVIDLEWLGVGRVRFGFYVFGKIYYCHQVSNVGTVGPYMQTANLPIRYELVGATGSSGNITQICSTVVSEGGYNPVGYPFSYGLTGTISGIDNSNWFPILALSGGNRISGRNYNHQTILPQNVEIVDTAQNNTTAYRIRLFFSPTNITLQGGTVLTWSQPSPNTNFSIASLANNLPTSITPSTDYISTSSSSVVVYNGLFGAKGTISFSDLSNTFNLFTQVSSDVNNVSDVVVVEARSIIGNPVITASINWQEIY